MSLTAKATIVTGRSAVVDPYGHAAPLRAATLSPALPSPPQSQRPIGYSIAAWAAAIRAIGTRNGEQET